MFKFENVAIIEAKKDWKVEEVWKLIEMYKNSPQLWDYNQFSASKKQRDEILERIGKSFNTNVASVSRKFHNLRSQYFDEVRKMEKKKPTDNPFVSNWAYFNVLTFLTKQKPTKKSKTAKNTCQNIGTPEEEENEDEGIDSQYYDQKKEQEVFSIKQPQDKKEENYMLQMFYESSPGLPEQTERQSEIEQPLPSTSETFQATSLTSRKRKYSSDNRNIEDDYSTFGAFVASEIRSLRCDSIKKKLKCSIMKSVLNAIEEDKKETKTAARHNSTIALP